MPLTYIVSIIRRRADAAAALHAANSELPVAITDALAAGDLTGEELAAVVDLRHALASGNSDALRISFANVLRPSLEAAEAAAAEAAVKAEQVSLES